MMFEAAELGRTIPKEEYKPRIPSTRLAPWTLVEGNDKYFARLKS